MKTKEQITDPEGGNTVIDLQQVDTLNYRGLTVPVWQATPGKGHSTTPFIRYDDLPADLAEALERWQYGATMPFHRAAFTYDFEIFMSKRGRKKMTERESLVHSTPISYFEGHGYYVRPSDILETYRSQFVTDSLGSTTKMIDGELVHFLNDWFKWLEIHFAELER